MLRFRSAPALDRAADAVSDLASGTCDLVHPQVPTSRDGPPTWRGRLHSWAFVCSIPAGVVLVVLAAGATARIAVAVYVVSLAAVFGTSATYHRLARSPIAKRRLQRLDHSMIYVLIAGTYTPLCVLAFPAAWGIPILAIVWGGALVGIVVKAVDIRRLFVAANALYIVLGWAAVVALPVVVTSIRPFGLVLMLTGGIAYTTGAIVFLRRSPDPRPDVFGFHEVWHAFTVIGAVSHFAMIWLIAA
jgi:hemolysin III